MKAHLCVVAVLCLVPVRAQSSRFLVSQSSNLEYCGDLFPALFTPFNFYVGIIPDADATAPGITGAEFRLDGVDSAWFVTVGMLDPAATIVGSPHQGGCVVSLSQCRATPSLLCAVQCIALSPIAPRLVIARAHTAPANPAFACPNVLLCDSPTATRVCLPSCGLCVNQVCTSAGCHGGFPVCEGGDLLAVRPSTWSYVRQLYRAQ